MLAICEQLCLRGPPERIGPDRRGSGRCGQEATSFHLPIDVSDTPTQEPVGEQVKTDPVDVEVGGVAHVGAPDSRVARNLLNRPLSDLRLGAMMLDGIELHGRTNIAALGITTEGDKLALGLRDGSTENAGRRLVAAGRSRRPRPGYRAGDAARDRRIRGDCGNAIRQVFGSAVPVRHCVQHKERNVLDHLCERDRQSVNAQLRQA
jgi:putative transposase